MASKPRVTQSGDELLFDWGPERVHVTLGRWRESRGDLWTEVVVRASAPGFPHDLHQSHWNLCSLSGREDLAKRLKGRYYLADQKFPDWTDIVESLARQALAIQRQGPPVTVLADLQPGALSWRVDRWIPETGVTVMFGDGGTAKSTLGLTISCCVETGRPFIGLPVKQGHVLYLDYETDEQQQARRLHAIARGLEVPTPRLSYLRLVSQLAQWGPELRHACAREKVSMVILDSLGYAGAAMNEAEPVIATYRVLQSLKVPVLALHHISKNSDGTTPYGSVYHRNSSRSLIEVVKEKEDEDGSIYLGWFHKKLNDERPQPALGIEVRFDAGVTFVRRADLLERPTLSERLPTSTRFLGALREGAQSSHDLAETLGKPENSIRTTASRLAKRGKILRLEDGRWGLPA